MTTTALKMQLAVVEAKHPSLVGLAGIVVQETAGTFRIVTSKNEIKGQAPCPLAASMCASADDVMLLIQFCQRRM